MNRVHMSIVYALCLKVAVSFSYNYYGGKYNRVLAITNLDHFPPSYAL